jgi:hypothetical protein
MDSAVNTVSYFSASDEDTGVEQPEERNLTTARQIVRVGWDLFRVWPVPRGRLKGVFAQPRLANNATNFSFAVQHRHLLSHLSSYFEATHSRPPSQEQFDHLAIVRKAGGSRARVTKMAEVVALGASIIAICQIADRLIGLCKVYIETVHDAPSDLRKIMVEMSALKTIFQDLEFLKRCDSKLSAVLESMAGNDRAIGACRQAMADMEKLFPQGFINTHRSADRASKRMKVAYKATLAALAWPLKASKAMRLLQDISMHKTTITLALTADSL